MQKISGEVISQGIIAELKAKPTPDKILAAILVGEDPASVSFLKQKEKIAKELGVDFRLYKLPRELKNDDLREEVRKIVNLGRVGGVVVQLPLPEHLNQHYILNVIPREKDIDVLGERALGAFYNNRNAVLPPAVQVVEEICRREKFVLESKKIAVLGLGTLVGKPVSLWLMNEVNNLYLIRGGGDFSVLNKADLVISGVGLAHIINPETLKPGAAVIDFGYDKKGGELMGDLDTTSDSRLKHLSFYTPVPGGTGPIGVAILFRNFYKLVLG